MPNALVPLQCCTGIKPISKTLRSAKTTTSFKTNAKLAMVRVNWD